MSESVRWCQCVSVVLVICVFSCYDASSVNGLYLVTCSLGRQTKNSYLGCQTGLSDCGIRLEMLVWVSGWICQTYFVRLGC